MSIKYWNNYYETQNIPFSNSLFSDFVLNKLKKSKRLIDIGCGNGRDSIFFSNNKIKTLGIDYSDSAINNLNKYTNQNLEFKKIQIEKINDDLGDEYFDYAYCRFLLHSLNENTETALFDWISKNVTDSIFIETRINKDLENEHNQNHYRRQIDPESLLKLIEDINFKISYSEISNKFSPYSLDYGVEDITKDPLLLRIVASKNSK